MSKRMILNTTSRKKRDTMLITTNTTLATPSGSTTYTNNDALLRANATYMFPWIPTWKNNGGSTTVYDEAGRTSKTCYMRGLKEKIRISTSDGTQWLWRRICFTMKGSQLYGLSTSGYTFAGASPQNGDMRVVNDVNNGSGQGATIRTNIIDLIFRGGNGRDWNNFFTAPLDPTRISVMYDKTISIQSGNQAGRNVVYNRWHPMNKNLVYDDDENGQETEPAGNSTRGKPGMGDYYVIDMFTSGSPISTETSGLSFSPEATLYWHEK